MINFFFRFQQLYDEWKSEGKKFRAIDYSVETPSWAVYGSEERGFDPDMKRPSAVPSGDKLSQRGSEM